MHTVFNLYNTDFRFIKIKYISNFNVPAEKSGIYSQPEALADVIVVQQRVDYRVDWKNND